MARLGQVTVAVMIAMFALAPAEQGFGAPPLPLTARVIAHGELAGFGPFGPAHVRTFETPAAFLAAYQQAATPSQVSTWAAQLKREGFVAVAVEELKSRAPNRGGLSWAMQMRSTADAQNELFRQAHRDKSHGSISDFAVPGIPTGIGFRSGSSTDGGDNILFSDGRFVYFVGIGWSGGKPARAALIAAAQKQYKRVRGHATT